MKPRSERLKMPPDLVIRASGVWNSRAPLNDYVQAHRLLQRHFYITAYALGALEVELAERANEFESARRVLPLQAQRKFGKWMWRRFERSFPEVADQSEYLPSVHHTRRAAKSALFDLRANAVVSLVSSFEIFVLCWSLNYLLAKLESNSPWTEAERDVAVALSPEHQWRPLPGWPWIAARMPWVEQRLSELPHVFTDPATQKTLDAPITAELNAYRVMRFWRDFRNRVVHANGVVSTEFYRQNNSLYELLRQPYGSGAQPLRAGHFLDLSPYVLPAVSTTHHRAAHSMNDVLLTLSGGRRGHVWAPAPHDADRYCPPYKRSPHLLKLGDHDPSLRWHGESKFRNEFRQAQRRRG